MSGVTGAGAPTVRLLTLNLQHVMPAAATPRVRQRPDREILREAAAQIAEIDADVVVLQEVDKFQRRSGSVDQTAAFAADLGLPYVRFAAEFAGSATGVRRPAWPSDAPGRPGYGVALLSRIPVGTWHVRPLRGAGLRLRRGGRIGFAISGVLPVIDPGRVCLAAVLRTPAGPLTVGVTHLSVDPPTAQRQLRTAVAALRSLPGPRVLAGDLNLAPEVVAATSGLVALAVGKTFSNVRPRTQIDHILGEGPVAAAGPARVHHLAVSDHAGLSVDLRVGAEPEAGAGSGSAPNHPEC
ncbi:endonuclease/exonuclease/phosphatase family protein [Georgenia sp.]